MTEMEQEALTEGMPATKKSRGRRKKARMEADAESMPAQRRLGRIQFAFEEGDAASDAASVTSRSASALSADRLRQNHHGDKEKEKVTAVKLTKCKDCKTENRQLSTTLQQQYARCATMDNVR